jgi:hypothetical protein
MLIGQTSAIARRRIIMVFGAIYPVTQAGTKDAFKE